MFTGELEPDQTLTIPNNQIFVAAGILRLTNNGIAQVNVIVRVVNQDPQQQQIQANNHVVLQIDDDTAVKNLGPGLINWQFN